MDKQEYNEKVSEFNQKIEFSKNNVKYFLGIINDCETQLNDLKEQYCKEHCKFKVGEYARYQFNKTLAGTINGVFVVESHIVDNDGNILYHIMSDFDEFTIPSRKEAHGFSRGRNCGTFF